LDSQLVDLGGLVAVVGFLWGVIVWSTRSLNRRLDHQDEVLAGMDARLTRVEIGQVDLKTGQARLEGDVAGLKEGLRQTNSRLDGMDSRLDGMDSRLDGMDSRLDGIGNTVIRIVADLGEVKGELKRIAPKEKVTAGGS